MRLPSLKVAVLVATTVLLQACNSGTLTGAVDPGDTSSSDALNSATQSAQAVRTDAATGLCLHVQYDDDKAGANIDVATCTGQAGQAFSLDSSGLVHVYGNLCLAAEASGTGAVTTATCSTGATNQQWQIQSNTLVAAASATCLTVSNPSPTPAVGVVTASCQAGDTAQAWTFGAKFTTSAASSSSGANAPVVDVTLGITQSGNGWPGSVNIASNSAEYLGMTIDQLEASGAPIGKALKAHSDVEAAIRTVSAQTGVPSGLLAGLCYQESSFSNTAYSKNPDPSSSDTADVGITQAPLEDFSGNSWQDPTTNLLDFVNKQGFLSGYRAHKSWGYMLRMWNSGEVLNVNNLGEENNATDPNYVVEILANHCMGKD